MPKIIKATDYGFRVVIDICMNPDDPESVHPGPDGKTKPHDGVPPTGTDPSLRPWQWCLDCRYNWDVREFVWTGEETYTRSTTGKRRAKTNTELIKEMEANLSTAGAPTEITGLTGVTLGL